MLGMMMEKVFFSFSFSLFLVTCLLQGGLGEGKKGYNPSAINRERGSEKGTEKKGFKCLKYEDRQQERREEKRRREGGRINRRR